MGHSHKQQQLSLTQHVHLINLGVSLSNQYVITLLQLCSFQVSTLSEIIFANTDLRLHVVHLTLADLIWR